MRASIECLQLLAHDLAGAGFRHVLHELHLARHLVGSEVCAGATMLSSSAVAPGLVHHIRFRNLTLHLVPLRADGNESDGGVHGDDAFESSAGYPL